MTTTYKHWENGTNLPRLWLTELAACLYLHGSGSLKNDWHACCTLQSARVIQLMSSCLITREWQKDPTRKADRPLCGNQERLLVTTSIGQRIGNDLGWGHKADPWVYLEQFQPQMDIDYNIVWKFEADWGYSSSSAYKVQFLGPTSTTMNKTIWKVWTPSKVKFFS